jgi:hypothetical protein
MVAPRKLPYEALNKFLVGLDLTGSMVPKFSLAIAKNIDQTFYPGNCGGTDYCVLRSSSPYPLGKWARSAKGTINKSQIDSRNRRLIVHA